MGRWRQDKTWLSCRPEDARRILINAYGKPRYLAMLFEYDADPPEDSERDWTKWLMYLVLQQKRIDTMR
jgi:hypothetical protein